MRQGRITAGFGEQTSTPWEIMGKKAQVRGIPIVLNVFQ